MSLQNHINNIETSLQKLTDYQERLSLEIQKELDSENKTYLVADLKDIRGELNKSVNDLKNLAEQAKQMHRDNVDTELKNQNWPLFNVLFGQSKFGKR